MAFAKLKIRTRFILLLGLFAAGFTIYGLWSFKTLDDLKVNGPIYQRIVQSKDLIADVLPPPEYIIESYLITLQLADATDKPQQAKLIDRLKTLKGDYDTRHEYWITAKETLEQPLRDIFLKDSYEPAVAFYNIAFNELVPAVQGGDASAVTAAVTKLNGAYETHRKAIDKVVEISVKRAADDEAAAKSRIASSSALLVTILALSVGAGVGLAWMIMRSILGPLQEAVRVAKTVASGDLTNRIEAGHTENETGQLLVSLKEMNESLVRIVAQVRVGTNSIADASSQIAAGNLDLSSRTEQQAGSLAETASAMEELTGTVKQNADNANQANQLALTASSVAGKGGAVVGEVVQTMGSINDSAKKIVDIISVIDGIAFQTNILALNAAVEAARAGEQGRGFAVVASEVRSLAQRSAGAAKEIKALISDSVEKVQNGSKLVDQAGATMNEVVASVKRVADIIGEIAAASREQTVGIERVGGLLARMDQATQQNAALVEEAAAAAESMHQQTEGLTNMVSVFKLSPDAVTQTATGPYAMKQAAATGSPQQSNRSPAPKRVGAGTMKQLASNSARGGNDWEAF
ncbi:MAG TPA: methyl-accepting chemotaxis protein [Noviherbaspirillum sp.]|uniref:methyl-accepting chemotaxis protein n=1 Tax=Noviherbaspirillum sp. TaxID=1926288 RepID=UPI002D31FB2A|nr:methyl-accepting chemotaxis protein [Noviherbaspirillum sp.]HYD94556.1 methyl-accepting chemotaxis protein [Noviherbaspirillum sp.]